MMRTLIMLIPLALASGKLHADPILAYHVGNSLSNQSMVHVGATLQGLANAGGIDYSYGRHIRCGSTLANIIQNPSDVCVSPIAPFGTFDNALPNYNWDAVTLQPYGGPFESERAAFNSLVQTAQQNPANAQTKFYLFSAWPQGYSEDSYATRWTRDYDPANDTAEGRWSREYATALLESLRGDNVGTDVFIIPAGEVLFEIDMLVQSGDVTTFETKEYSSANTTDPFHLDTAGSYVSRLTWYSTLFGQSPEGLPIPENTGLSDEDGLLIQQRVWDVVTRESSVTGVPEPSSVTALVVLGACFMSRRRVA